MDNFDSCTVVILKFKFQPFRFLRAVSYRWLVRWICGYMGWDNTRPLPACVYHNIRQRFPTEQIRGYQTAQRRDWVNQTNLWRQETMTIMIIQPLLKLLSRVMPQNNMYMVQECSRKRTADTATGSCHSLGLHWLDLWPRIGLPHVRQFPGLLFLAFFAAADWAEVAASCNLSCSSAVNNVHNIKNVRDTIIT